jgi:hypothetical protein
VIEPRYGRRLVSGEVGYRDARFGQHDWIVWGQLHREMGEADTFSGLGLLILHPAQGPAETDPTHETAVSLRIAGIKFDGAPATRWPC